MNKHERAVAMHRKEALRMERLLANTGANRSFEDDLGALAYALRILEAVEGVEEWMVDRLAEQATFTAQKYGVKAGHSLLDIRAALQAILDAKADV